MERWEVKEGVGFLRKIGIKSGQSVLDFGCRVGHYTIPAAKAVGSTGIVYSVDKEQEALNELQQKVKHTLEDGPIQEFRSLSLSDVKREIKASNFVFERRFCGLISHDDGLNQGCVLNFSKSQ